MPIGRDYLAAAIYVALPRNERETMVYQSLCDEAASAGLARNNNAVDFYYLSVVRSRPVFTRHDRMKRKADFYHVLARMAARDQRQNIWQNL